MDYKVTYRNKDKSIQCIISYKDSDGKWRQKSKQGLARQKDYKDWINDTVEELKKTIKIPEEFKGITFGEFRMIFLKDKRRYSENTKTIYENSHRWFKSLSDIPLIDINYIDIKPCVDKMIDSKSLANSTMIKYLANEAAIFNHAKKNYEIITDNPIKKNKYEFPLEEKIRKVNALNREDLNVLLSKLDGKDYIISLIASKCGLRIGEIIGLQDTSFDFKSAEIKIDKQWKKIDKDGSHGFGTPKTKNSYRTTPIPLSYVAEIKDYVTNCVIGIDRRVFPDKTTTNASSRLNKKYKRLKHEISVHDLRHTYATTLIANGFDFKTVAELLGDTVETVIKTYSHFIDDMYESAKNRINNIM